MQSELKPCYLLMKRGLYYAPDRQGYTGVKARAGRYREVDALGLDGVTAIHEDDAAEFSPACWPDTKEAVLRAEITRLTEALREARRIDRGRVVVPVEPTSAMKMAGAAAITEDHMAKMANYDAAIDCWAAMLNEWMKDINA